MATYLHKFNTEQEYNEERGNKYKEPWVSLTLSGENRNEVVSVIVSGALINWDSGDDPTEADFTNHDYDGEYMFCGKDAVFNNYVYSGNNGIIATTVSCKISLDDEYIYNRCLDYFNESTEKMESFLVIKNNYQIMNLCEVNYNKSESDIRLSVPLTFEIISGGSISWQTFTQYDKEYTIEYKKNDGEWTEITSSYSNPPAISVVAGDTVQFRGNNVSYTEGEYGTSSHFTNGGSSCRFIAKGNIMSLINSTNFATIKELPVERTFSGLFGFCDGIVDASELLLPATIITSLCYSAMFDNCTNLVSAPSILPSINLGECSSNCYMGMFNDCSSLVNAPALPATTLAESCYDSMFAGCTSLVTAPELPATTLAIGCYRGMFNGCRSLNYIKCLATDISATGCVDTWTNGVASSGTFVIPGCGIGWRRGNGYEGFPVLWDVFDLNGNDINGCYPDTL